MAKYLIMVMLELKMKPEILTMIFEDNVMTIMMTNANKLNRRTRMIGHIGFKFTNTPGKS
eukprot:6084539-Ditylum_brightwellii.AAC.1